MTDPGQTAIVILNWNGADDTLACLDSFGAVPEATLIVVDNGSHDDSVRRISDAYPDVTLLETGDNLGFSAGNNVGIAWALQHGFEIVGILNNDTLVEPGFTAPLIEVISADPTAAFVSPRITYVDDPSATWFSNMAWEPRTRVLVHTARAADPGGDPHPVPSVTGCALFAHCEVWRAVGRLDPAYFLGFEDSDWCLRAGRLGCQGYVVDRSIVLHRVSSSIRASARLDGYYYYGRNGIRMLTRNGRTRSVTPFVLRLLVNTARALRDDNTLPRWPRIVLTGRGLIDGLRGRGGRLPTNRFTRT